MNPSLLARTRREFYADWEKHVLAHGASLDEVEKSIGTLIEEAQSLLDGKCPKCAAPIARYIDRELQHGPSGMPGVWVQYRCSTQAPPGQTQPDDACTYMVDLREGHEAD
jgi:hypothetical protein